MSRKQQEASVIFSFIYNKIDDDDNIPISGQTTPRGPSPPLSDTQSYVTALESPDFSVVGSDGGSDGGSDSTEEYTSAEENLTDSTHVDLMVGTITTDTPASIITFSPPSPPQPPSKEKPQLDEESSSTSRQMQWSTKSDGFQNFENGLQYQRPSVEDDVEEELHPCGDEDSGFKIRPLSEYEMALTGANVITDPESSRNHTATVSRGMETEVVRLPIVNRRAHAIPIRAPPSSRSHRIELLPAFQHGIAGVPSHYIPLQGALIGMFFDPVTSMYVGDGPSRSTPHRSDGTVPTTISREQFNIETVSVNIDDMVHVQSPEQINSVDDEADEHAAINSQPGQVHFDLSYTPTSVPTRPYEAYWCSCRQTWLSYPHDCPDPPTPAFPTTMPIRPGTELPADWITHRIVVDSSIYPGEVVPQEALAGTAPSSADGKDHGSNLPARWFAPGPAEFEVGPMAEVLRNEASDSEAAYDNVVCSASSEVYSIAHFPKISNPHPRNNAPYPPTHGMYVLNHQGRLAVLASPYDDDLRSGSETEVPKKRNRRNKRTGHRGRADKFQVSTEENDGPNLPVFGGNHEVHGEAEEKQPEPKGRGKDLPTMAEGCTVSVVENGKQSEPQGKAKKPAKEEEKADEDTRLSEVARGKRPKLKSHSAGPTNLRSPTENDKGDLNGIRRGKGPESAMMVPPTTEVPLSFRNNRSIVATPQEIRVNIASASAKQPSKPQQTWSAIAQGQTLKKPTPACSVIGKKAEDTLTGAFADVNKTPERNRSSESEWTEVVSSATKKALKSSCHGGKDNGKLNLKGPKGG